MCLRVLELMASTISAVPLGLLRMRDFQRWVFAQRLCTRRHLNRQIEVTSACLSALCHWKSPTLYVPGNRQMHHSRAGEQFMTEKQYTVWTPQLCITNINYLELLTVFLSLKYFLPSLRNCHVMIRLDNTTEVAYINHQGGTPCAYTNISSGLVCGA